MALFAEKIELGMGGISDNIDIHYVELNDIPPCIAKFLSSSWAERASFNDYTEKAILGASSGLYIPLIYALVCDRFKAHQQGLLCGILEATATFAEILSPLTALAFIRISSISNLILLIISLGFFTSFYIIVKKPKWIIYFSIKLLPFFASISIATRKMFRIK